MANNVISTNICVKPDMRACMVTIDKVEYGAWFHKWDTNNITYLQTPYTIRKGDRISTAKAIKDRFDSEQILESGCEIGCIPVTVALVEMFDGTMRQIPISDIRFLDTEEDSLAHWAYRQRKQEEKEND